VAQLVPAMHQYRHLFTVALLQIRVGVNVDDHDLEMKKALQPPQGLDHFVAQMAIGAAIDGQRQPVRAYNTMKRAMRWHA